MFVNVFSCPKCSNPVDVKEKTCPHCDTPLHLPPAYPAERQSAGFWAGQSRSRKVSIIFLVIAGIFILFGLDNLVSASRLVIGDSFDYIISASRGTGEICAGIFCVLISILFAIFDVADARK